MTTPDTAEKISPVGSAPSEEAVPPQTHHCGASVREAISAIQAPPPRSLSGAMRDAEDRRSSNLTATMINQAIGMTLVNLGKTEITFSETEIIAFAANHRVAMHQNHDYSFTVSVTPRVPE